MAKVVVTTSSGLEGVDAEPERQVRVAEDAPAFAAAVRRAIDDENVTLGVRARDLAVSRHGWPAACSDEEVLDGCLAQP